MDNAAQSSAPSTTPEPTATGSTPPAQPTEAPSVTPAPETPAPPADPTPATQPEAAPVTPPVTETPTSAPTEPSPAASPEPAPVATPPSETPPPPPPPAPDPTPVPPPPPADPPAAPKPADPPSESKPSDQPAPTADNAPAVSPTTPTPEPSAKPEQSTEAPSVTPAPETPAPTTTPTDAKPENKPAEAPTNASLSGNQTPPPPMQPRTKRFRISPWTMLLILVLAGFCGFLLYITLTPKNKPTPTNQQSYAPTPTPVAQSVLSLQPSQAGSQAAQLGTQSYDVVIDSGSNIVNAVQLELSYDPTVLTNVSITPGTFFATPMQLVKDIDAKNGRISYAIGVEPKDKGLKGTGVVAQVMFQFSPTATVSSTMIKFLPKTLVAAQGVNPSVLKSTTDATITVPSKTGAKTPSAVLTATPTGIISK